MVKFILGFLAGIGFTLMVGMIGTLAVIWCGIVGVGPFQQTGGPFGLGPFQQTGGPFGMGSYSGSQPTLTAVLAVPDEVAVGETFLMKVTAGNPHDEVVVLDSIDVYGSFLQGFQVLDVDPAPTDQQSFEDMRCWFFETPVDPGNEIVVTWKLKAVEAGRYCGDVDVCNPNQDWVTVVPDVIVREPD